MDAKRIFEKLSSLENRRQLCIIGAAIIDIVSNVDELPIRGGDLALKDEEIHVGGCAYNIAITLKRLGLYSINALPLGNGRWSDIVKSALREQGLESHLYNQYGDNGWCLALVEPDGERTFLSASGIENEWSEELLSQLHLDEDAIVYVSGYQLASSKGYSLISWLESLPSTTDIFIDFGPRISQLPKSQVERLIDLNPIVSLNRQEAAELGMLDEQDFTSLWQDRFGCKLLLRIDSDGALFSNSANIGHVMSFETTVIDTIGAGDCHAGGVLAGLASGWCFEDSIVLGNAIASFVVSHPGGDCAPTKSEITSYLQQYI